MEFYVYSRGAIERLSPHDVPHVVVSITTTAEDVAKIPSAPSCRGVLRLSFPDLDVPLSDGPPLFCEEQAHAIWEFVLEHRPEVRRIVLHCDAGVSRSPAVAAAIARGLGLDDAEFFKRYRPNMRVYRTLLEVWQSTYAGRDG
jgi:predicted protein tyrosine phosphatase